MLKLCLSASFVAGSFLVVSCGSGAGGVPTPGSTFQSPSGTDQSAPGDPQSPLSDPQGPGGSASGGDPCEQLCAAAASCGSMQTGCVGECRYGSVLFTLVGCGAEWDGLMACAQSVGVSCTDNGVDPNGCEAQTAAVNACLESVDPSTFGQTCTLADRCGGCIEGECDLCNCATNGDVEYCAPVCATVVEPTPCTLEGDSCAGCATDCEICNCASPTDPTVCTTICGGV